MKTKSLFIFCAIVMSSLSLLSQDCQMYFPAEEDSEIEIKNYNQKDKLIGSSIQKVVKKNISGNTVNVSIAHQSFDEKGKELTNGEFEVRCENGTFYLDMRNYMDEQALEAYQEMEIEVDAIDMEFPVDLDVGKDLPDAAITIKVKSQGMTLVTMKVNITNRKIETKESITTPAGTFDCYKMSYDIDTKMVMRIEAKGIEWIAKDIGMVRSESYNKKGKLQSYSLLSSIK